MKAKRRQNQTKHFNVYHQRILNALAEQLAEEGLEEFSIPKVAQRAGISTRTIYRYFPTKNDLLAAVASWVTHRVLFSNIDLKAANNPDELIQSMGKAFKVYDEHKDIVRAGLVSKVGVRLEERLSFGSNRILFGAVFTRRITSKHSLISMK